MTELEGLPTEAPLEPITFVEAVLRRPRMYTAGGTLAEVAAFLEGFASGLAAHTADRGRIAEAERWWSFREWLCARLALERADPHRPFAEIAARSADEAAAVRLTLAYYQAFRRAGSAAPTQEA